MGNKEFILGADYLSDLGNQVSKFLIDCGVEETSELTIKLNEKDFKKVDEDLFYRIKEEEDSKFIPSDSEINLSFNKLMIKIIKMP